MTYTVTVTSQGQISIPAPIRRQMGLDKTKKVVIEMREDKTAEIRPVRDFMDLAGTFKSNKKIPFKVARAKFEEYMANRSKWKNT